MRPPDCTLEEWERAVRQVFAAARGDKFLEHVPSHWLDAMRDSLLAPTFPLGLGPLAMGAGAIATLNAPVVVHVGPPEL